MGGDIYLLPTHLPNRSNDYAVDVKGEAGPSNPPNDDKGKATMINIVTLEQRKNQSELNVMPLGKRNPNEKEGRNATRASKKKGKAKEEDDAKAKKKRRSCRKFHVFDFLLGVGKESYNL